MITELKKAANAFGGRTARACDSCLRKRARWYCTADDAFLCQACDSSVHLANLLASRHERVRLERVPNPKIAGSTSLEPAWLQGFTKKARTPRHTKPVVKPCKEEDGEEENKIFMNPQALVPELDSEENSPHENEEMLLYRVPVCDPSLFDNSFTPSVYDEACELDAIQGFDLPSDMDLAEFAADVESLLGGGLDHDSCAINDLGFFDSIELEKEENSAILLDDCLKSGKLVKVENEIMNWDFEYGVVGEEEEKVVVPVFQRAATGGDCEERKAKSTKFLRLDYEAVIGAWACKGCPWTNGTRPELNPDDCWPDFLGSYQDGTLSQPYIGAVKCGDAGREARVLRYREKRRTRLFSKKIRYQVRKLNAEKRPRIKGRFVKRPSLFAPPQPNPSFPDYQHLIRK